MLLTLSSPQASPSRRTAWALLLLLALASVGRPAVADHGWTQRVSISTSGAEANGESGGAEISGNGRFVAFHSLATNLVAGDTNGQPDVFVHDRATGRPTRVSVTSSGEQANVGSGSPSISGDGRFVAFHSAASNLVPADTNRNIDVFVHDRRTGRTERVSVSSTREEGNGSAMQPSISADGRYVVFTSFSSTLVADDRNPSWDIFLHDRATHRTSLVSLSSTGEQGNNLSDYPHISANGRHVVFTSIATNLVEGDTNRISDIFVRDLHAGTTVRASVSSGGSEPNGGGSGPGVIDGRGRFVAFTSYASNLVPGDTNHVRDVFLRDLSTGRTTRVSVSSAGTQAEEGGNVNSISWDGRYIAFDSISMDLVSDDTNAAYDGFLHDRVTGETVRISVSSGGHEGSPAFPISDSAAGSLSASGRFAAFPSSASNLVFGDTNLAVDVFVHDLRPRSTCPSGAYEEGPVSGLMLDYVEPGAGPAGPRIRALDCDIIVPQGL